MLAHTARRAAGAAGVDDAGEVIAPRRLALRQRAPVVGLARHYLVPAAGFDARRIARCGLVHPDDQRDRRAGNGGYQLLGDLRGRIDHRARAAVADDMRVIAGGVGGVGGDGHRACRHDGEVGDAEFRPVLADQHHPVAGADAIGLQRGGKAGHLARDLGPAQRLPFPVLLAPEEGAVATVGDACEEHVGEAVESLQPLSRDRLRHASPHPPGPPGSGRCAHSASATPGLRGSAAPCQPFSVSAAALALSGSRASVTLCPIASRAGFMGNRSLPSSITRPSRLK